MHSPLLRKWCVNFVCIVIVSRALEWLSGDLIHLNHDTLSKPPFAVVLFSVSDYSGYAVGTGPQLRGDVVRQFI